MFGLTENELKSARCISERLDCSCPCLDYAIGVAVKSKNRTPRRSSTGEFAILQLRIDMQVAVLPDVEPDVLAVLRTDDRDQRDAVGEL